MHTPLDLSLIYAGKKKKKRNSQQFGGRSLVTPSTLLSSLYNK